MRCISAINRSLVFSLCVMVALACNGQTRQLHGFSGGRDAPTGWSTSVDFFVWLPSEDVASIWADVITIGPNTSTWSLPSFDFDWDYGFRLGAARDLTACCLPDWDTAVYWSWFQTEAQHEIPPQADMSLGAEFDAAFLAGVINSIAPSSMDGRWSLLLNVFDWEVGQRYRLGKKLCIRPFLGLKGGWINQTIHANYYDLIISNIFPTNHSGSEKLTNNFWGIGPLGGINTKWCLCDFKCGSFDLFGDVAAAMMWGTWDCTDVYQDSLSHSFSVVTKKDSLGAPMFRGFWGLGWETDLCGECFHFALNVGYEAQLWLNQLRLATFQVQRLHHDLTLQGITFRSRLDF